MESKVRRSVEKGAFLPMQDARNDLITCHNPCISFDSRDPTVRVSHHRAHHKRAAQDRFMAPAGAPGRIRTCDTRFRKRRDGAYYAVYVRLWWARGSQQSRHTPPDDPSSRHKPCHGPHPALLDQPDWEAFTWAYGHNLPCWPAWSTLRPFSEAHSLAFLDPSRPAHRPPQNSPAQV